LVGPPLTYLKGYAPMKQLGWGEPLPRQVYFEWRSWCLQKTHFRKFLVQHTGSAVFADFTAPITAIHTTDDYIANKKTVPALLDFYPASPHRIICIKPGDHGLQKIGHTGIFRSKHQNTLWPLIIAAMEAS
jgi:predicted alpha/beta hydrolase